MLAPAPRPLAFHLPSLSVERPEPARWQADNFESHLTQRSGHAI